MSPSRQNVPLRNKNEFLRALRLTLWIVPALMFLIGVIYTVIEHRQHLDDPVWPWPTYLAVAVLVIAGPALSWLVLRWAISAAHSYLESQDQLNHRAEELATLNKLSVAASHSLDLETRINTILDHTIQALDADAGMVFIQRDG